MQEQFKILHNRDLELREQFMVFVSWRLFKIAKKFIQYHHNADREIQKAVLTLQGCSTNRRGFFPPISRFFLTVHFMAFLKKKVSDRFDVF